MFKPDHVERLSIPMWEAVYREEIIPGVISYIAVHDTSRGYALGGCRMAMYENEAEALTDVLRLSRGMTFKNAVADLPLGGGKSVIICDPKVKGKKREAILHEFGKFVAWVNCQHTEYCTAEDMNTTVDDMNIVKQYTKNIFGTKIDPSPFTAYGVSTAIEYTVNYFARDLFHGDKDISGKNILIQGMGKVGMKLLDLLTVSGANIYISDLKKDTIKEALKLNPDAKVVASEDVFKQKVDVFSPCARGEVISEQNIKKLKFKIICGAANNQLQNALVGEDLHKKGIIYCPDYVVNMGGVCSIQYLEIDKLNEEKAVKKIKRTVRKMLGLTFRTAFKNNLSFNAAIEHAVKRILGKTHQDYREFSNARIFPLTNASEFNV